MLTVYSSISLITSNPISSRSSLSSAEKEVLGSSSIMHKLPKLNPSSDLSAVPAERSDPKRESRVREET